MGGEKVGAALEKGEEEEERAMCGDGGMRAVAEVASMTASTRRKGR